MKIQTEVTSQGTQERKDTPTVRLFVSNIGLKNSYDEVVAALSAKARVIDLTLPAGTETNENKGYALCRVTKSNAEILLKGPVTLGPRILRIQIAR